MSFATAVADLQTQLALISGVAEYGDPRVATLHTVGGGDIDGAYLLTAETVGEPWIEAEVSPTHWFAKMRLEICTLLHTDVLTQQATVATRAQGAQTRLLHTSHTNGTVFNSQPAVVDRVDRDRRMIWLWRFSLRYIG